MSYIKLDRKITEWEWFTDPNTLMVWIYLLTNAQYQDGSYRGVELKRGQLLTGRRKLSEKLGVTRQTISLYANGNSLPDIKTLKKELNLSQEDMS